jgi:predicted enzyme related to lactoylglutathione lyase
VHERLQIGFDSEDPEGLAPFWAAALGYQIGDFDQAGTYLDPVPPDASLPIVYLQRVPEPKQVKNRLHIDLYVLDPETKIDELITLGATKLGGPQTGSQGGWWQVMADPQGNEFCVCREG